MSTTIATKNEMSFPVLTPNSRQAKIIASNMDGAPMSESRLIKVKVPLGGSTQWTIDVNGNVETTDEIVGLLVGVGKRGYLWPSEDPTEQKPVLVTNDLKVAYRVSDDLGTISPESLEKFRTGDGTYDWMALSNSKAFGFGSARGGVGRRVKEYRILAILRYGDIWPVLVSIGGGSMRNWEMLCTHLPCLRHEAVIGIKAVKAKSKGGQPYSQVVFRHVKTISEEEGNEAFRIYADPLDRMFSTPPVGANGGDGGDDE